LRAPGEDLDDPKGGKVKETTESNRCENWPHPTACIATECSRRGPKTLSVIAECSKFSLI